MDLSPFNSMQVQAQEPKHNMLKLLDSITRNIFIFEEWIINSYLTLCEQLLT